MEYILFHVILHAFYMMEAVNSTIFNSIILAQYLYVALIGELFSFQRCLPRETLDEHFVIHMVIPNM